jgi:hypothetical protein
VLLEEADRLRALLAELAPVAARAATEHNAHRDRTEAGLERAALLEVRRAAALRELARRAARRAEAQAAEREETARTREAVIWARALKVPVERVVAAGGLAVDTVTTWTRTSRSVPRKGAEVTAESRIRAAYWLLAREPQDLVPLAALRAHLAEVPREEVDAALAEMERHSDAHLVPQADRKRLTEDDRAAAVRIGGVDKHLLIIDAA